MKILQVNSFYYNRGGDCTHMFAVTKLLEAYGHTIIPFAMNYPLNFRSDYSKYWSSYIDYREIIKSRNLKNAIKVISRSIYSFEAKRCIAQLLDDERPDLVHIHNIMHHITPSILGEIKKKKIPIVWTLHDYTIVCPNSSFLTEKGEVCEACKKRKFFMATVKRCKKNSLAASFVAMLENYMHRFMNIYRHVDRFIAPSEFLHQKFIEYGMGEKVVTLNNFVNVNSVRPNYSNDGYCMYIGRLNHIKGVDTLIEAMKKTYEIRLKVVGDGVLLKGFRSEKVPYVVFEEFKVGKELKNLITNAMFIIVPSEWYENFPYSILEAFVSGKPVIGSRIGGIPELVKDNETGLTFEPGNTEDLRSKIEYLVNNPDKIVEMGKNARKFVERELNAEKYYQRLMEIYEQVLARSS